MLMVMEVRRERWGMLVDTKCSSSFLVHDTANDLNPDVKYSRKSGMDMEILPSILRQKESMGEGQNPK